MKKCNKCNQFKKLDDFNKNKNNKDGFDYLCKTCRKEINKEYYKKVSEKKKRRFKEIEKAVIIEELEKNKIEHGTIDNNKIKTLKWAFIDYPSDFLPMSLSHYDFCKKYNLNISEYLYIRDNVYNNNFNIY